MSDGIKLYTFSANVIGNRNFVPQTEKEKNSFKDNKKPKKISFKVELV